MKRTALLLAIGSATILCSAGCRTAGPAAPAASDASIRSLLDAAAAWDYDKSRAPLYAFSEAVQRSAASKSGRRAFESAILARLSQPGLSRAARQYLYRELGAIGSDAAVAPLAAALSDPVAGGDVLLALEPVPGAAVDQALSTALGRASGPAAIGILGALGRRASSSALPAIEAKAAGPDATVAAAAAAALGHIGGEKAAAALQAMYGSGDRARHSAGAAGLLRCADGFLAAGKNEAAADLYGRLAVPGSPAPVREAAFLGLLRADPKAAPQRIIAALRGTDPHLRMQAAAFPREMADVKSLCVVAGALPLLVSDIQIQLMAALADRGERQALPPVLVMAQSTNEEVRLAALKTIGTLGDGAVVPFLARLAAEGEGAGKAAARQSLHRLPHPSADRAILDELPRSQGALRRELVAAAGARGIHGSRDPLLAVLADPDAAVRTEAIRALSRVAEPADLPAMIPPVCSLSVPAERKAAVLALESVAKKSGDAASRAKPFVAAYPSVTAPDGQALLLAAMGRLGGPAALEIVRREAGGAVEALRRAAVEALLDWPDPAAIPDLQKLKDSPDERVRLLSRRSMLRLVRLDATRSETDKLAVYQDALQGGGAEEKRLALAGLGDLSVEAAFDAAVERMDDAAVRAEAELAAVQIASRNGTAFAAKAVPVLRKIRADGAGENVRKQAGGVLEKLKP